MKTERGIRLVKDYGFSNGNGTADLSVGVFDRVFFRLYSRVLRFRIYSGGASASRNFFGYQNGYSPNGTMRYINNLPASDPALEAF